MRWRGVGEFHNVTLSPGSTSSPSEWKQREGETFFLFCSLLNAQCLKAWPASHRCSGNTGWIDGWLDLPWFPQLPTLGSGQVQGTRPPSPVSNSCFLCSSPISENLVWGRCLEVGWQVRNNLHQYSSQIPCYKLIWLLFVCFQLKSFLLDPPGNFLLGSGNFIFWWRGERALGTQDVWELWGGRQWLLILHHDPFTLVSPVSSTMPST